MALVEYTLFGTVDKVQNAINRLKAFEPPEGYYVAFSGGKDSQCIYHLCEMAGVKFDAHYAVTSVDPPELVRFMMKQYPDVEFEYHRFEDGRRKTMWNIIEQHTIPPTRQARYCCSELKETGGKGRVVVTGVRWAESARRKEMHGVAEIRTTAKKLHKQAEEGDSAVKKTKKGNSVVFLDDNGTARKMVEQCYAKKKTTVNPIVDWTDDDVWEFLNDVAKVPHCSLYDEGFTRLGCIGCPLKGRDGMIRDFERWPRYKMKYIKAFGRSRMIANHSGEIKVATGEVAKPNEGGYSDIHRLGRLELLTSETKAKRPTTQESSQTIQVERERSGPQTSGGPTDRRQSDGGWRTTADMVAVDATVGEGRAEPVEVGEGGGFFSNKIPGMEWWRQTAEWNFNFWVNNS